MSCRHWHWRVVLQHEHSYPPALSAEALLAPALPGLPYTAAEPAADIVCISLQLDLVFHLHVSCSSQFSLQDHVIHVILEATHSCAY